MSLNMFRPISQHCPNGSLHANSM